MANSQFRLGGQRNTVRTPSLQKAWPGVLHVDLNLLPLIVTAASTVLFSTVMSVPATDNLDTDILRSVVEHVFMPPKLPQVGPDEETERKTNVALCDNLIEAAQAVLKILPSSESPLWIHMIKMMEVVRRAANAALKEDDLQRVLSDMAPGSTYR